MKRVQTRLNFENDTIHDKKKNEMQCTASGHYYISVSLWFLAKSDTVHKKK